MVVGSGFSLDMTDFFKFKKRKNKYAFIPT